MSLFRPTGIATLRTFIILGLLFLARTGSFAGVFYVSVNGDDAADGSAGKPWRTVAHALKALPPHAAHTLVLSAGIFIEKTILSLPPGVSLEGAGREQTILKGDTAVHFTGQNQENYGSARFLLQLASQNQENGNQHLRGFSIDGDSKKLHGGIYVHQRNNITIEQVGVRGTGFSGIWLTAVNAAVVREVRLLNCAWGSVSWCSGALQIGDANTLELDNLDINEDTGYGIKTLGADRPILAKVTLHDSRISVNPVGLWREGKSPNIAMELWANAFPESVVYNCYFDNVISLVNVDDGVEPTGRPLRLHHNIFDLMARAKGKGYAVEMAITDVEFDHNWIKGGYCGIANWGKRVSNWNIHHNTFYGLNNIYPTAVIASHRGGFKDVNLYNNTVELTGTATVSFVQIDNAGVGENLNIKNNLIINSTTGADHYPSGLIRLDNGGGVKNLNVTNNLLYKLEHGNAEGNFSNNLTADPLIMGNGKRPSPYYMPRAGSPLIDSGTKVGLPYEGAAADIGAYEAIPEIK